MSQDQSQPGILSTLRKILRRNTLAFRFHEWWLSRKNEKARLREDDTPWPQADENGLAIPSAYLMVLVAGHSDWRSFLSSGEEQLNVIAYLVERNGGTFRNAARILDLGCGCGRLSRHAQKISNAELVGVDYNPRLVNWCAENLPGTFAQNQVTPPLNFPDEHFDAIWLLSVFTHLRFETQNEWLQELARIVKPGGTVVITFHDEHHPGMDLIGMAAETLIEKQTHIHNDQAEGSNFISTFQTQDYTRKQFSEWFDVAEMVPSQQTALVQAAAVLRRKA